MSFNQNFSNGGAAGQMGISGYKLRSTPNFTRGQSQLHNILTSGALGSGQNSGLSMGLQHLQGLAGGDEESFDQMEAPSYAAFDKLLGTLGSRFSEFGARDSSAFQNAVSGAGGQLAQNLGSQRHDVMQSALDKLLGLSNSVLGQKPYENSYQQNSKVDWGALIGQLAPTLLALL